jgi:hypothetical protein
MPRNNRARRTARRLRQSIEVLVDAARVNAKASKSGGAAGINIAGRSNRSVAVNTGEPGAVQHTTSTQYVPITQVRDFGRKEDSRG